MVKETYGGRGDGSYEAKEELKRTRERRLSVKARKSRSAMKLLVVVDDRKGGKGKRRETTREKIGERQTPTWSVLRRHKICCKLA